MVFAAGVGSRLRPLTDTCPKALIEVGGEPVLGHVLRNLRDAGITEAVVNVHHHGQMIRDWLDSNRFTGLKVTVSDETDRLLDTGGGLAAAAPLFRGEYGPILLHNADILTDVSLREMIRAHETELCRDVTLLVDSRDSSRRLLFEIPNRMRGWKNMTTSEVRPPTLTDTSRLTPWAFGGVHIINRDVLDKIALWKPGEAFSIMDFYIANCNSLIIGSYLQWWERYRWFDIGRPESLRAAREACEQ
ncbi:MAG: nucleotidyltransferase family protein [Clostridium sp.]|nr:nucleotidyltransferase family protein [Clostridium sp.]